MIRVVLRSVAVTVLIVILAFLADWGTFAWTCEQHRSAVRGHDITVREFAVPLPGEVVLACTNEHCFGYGGHTLACHTDLSCYCTPAEGSEDPAVLKARMERRLGPSQCLSAAVSASECPPGRCRLHVDP